MEEQKNLRGYLPANATPGMVFELCRPISMITITSIWQLYLPTDLCLLTFDVGEGDPTDNSVKFFAALNMLLEEGERGALRELQYAAFGLGNRNYKHYNSGR